MQIQSGKPGRLPPLDAFVTKDWDLGGEHPSVILRDVASRPRARGHVIVFANEKGGVGKSTLAFHTAISLCDAGKKVAVIDLDHGQATLSGAMINREATCRLLKIGLPTPRWAVFTLSGAACLSQEIARIGSDCEYVIIDAAGSDTPIGRRAIAMADTLVTPVGMSFADLDLLGQFDALSMKLRRQGRFARLVAGLAQAREAYGRPEFDWVVIPNRSRINPTRNEVQITKALKRMAKLAGFRLARGIGERVAYRELFLYGLTHFDLGRIPNLARSHAGAKQEIVALLADLRLPISDEEQVSLFADLPSANLWIEQRPLAMREQVAAA